jgi:multiple antibiotic resistance protein
MLKNILLAFIPVFVAVDAIAVLPIFINLTEGLSQSKRAKIIRQSIYTALIVAVGFIFLGRFIFNILGITVGDFLIAGGIVLFVLAINDIITNKKRVAVSIETLGAVPIGVPLIVGPAVLTTSLMIIHTYGLIPTLVSILANILIAGIIFSSAGRLIKLLGEPGTKALSKITSLLLAAIAVMMVRKGMFLLLQR